MRKRFYSSLALAFALGCGATDAGEAGGGLGGADAMIDPTLEAVYTVGALDGEDWETFGRLDGIGFDATGNLYVFDRDALQITVLDPTGGHARTFGKRGGGPGEFQQVFAFTVFKDGTSAAFDIGYGGFHLFDSMGEFQGGVPLSPESGYPGTQLFPFGSDAVISWGGIRFSTSEGSQSMMMGGEEETRPVDRFALGDGTKDVVYEAWNPPPPQGDESEMNFSEGDSQMQIQMAPMEAFQPDLYARPLSDGRLAVADSVGYRVKLVDAQGGVTTIERPISPIEATEAIREREREVRLAAAAERGGGQMIVLGGGGGGMGIDPDAMRKMMEDQISTMQFGTHVPVIAGLGVDWSDRIWVERSGEPGAQGPIDILGSDGHYFGTIAPGGIRIPDAFGPDGLLAYIDTDEIGVQRVRVVRLADGETLEGAADH